MRIRKLASELGVDPLLVLGWLRELGYPRYHDPEQQLGPDVEQRVRIHQRELPRIARSYLPPSSPKALPPIPVEVSELRDAMKGVAPLGARAPAPAHRAPVRPPPARAPAPDPLRLVLEEEKRAAERAASAAVIARDRLAAERDALGTELASARAELAELRVTLTQTRTERDAFHDELAAARADLFALRGAHGELRAAHDTLVAAHEALAARADPAGRTAAPAPPVSTASALRTVFERRGLRSDDEIVMAIRALLDARRDAELLPLLSTPDHDALLSLLERRLVLLAEGDEVPLGAAAIRVGSDRSEGDPPSAVRDALRRFSTACLVRNLKSVVIVGGSPAYHRVLKEGVDPRVRLRLVPGTMRGNIPDFPSAELVIVWASTILDHRVSQRFPDALIVPVRGISRMLTLAAEHIEST